MQLTSQTRLTLTPEAAEQLDAFAHYYAKHLHLLYALVAREGGRARNHKTAFCRRYGVSARLFNALAVELQGLLDGTRELLKANLSDARDALAATRRALKGLETRMDKVQAGKLTHSKAAYARLERQIAKRRRKIHKLEHKLPQLQARLAANVPGIGFGSRKLFAKQYHLEENGFQDHAAWLTAWRDARAHQIAFLGSKDETAGNQTCSLFAQADGTFQLRVRMPDALRGADSPDKYLWLEGIRFHKDEPQVHLALLAGQAMTYKLHRENGHWRLLVTFERQAAEKRTCAPVWGCVGVDFNADHLGVAETDASGNITKAWRIDLPLADKTSGQRKALMSDALQQVVQYALDQKKPIVIEELDFSGKKKQLASMSAGRARMLSGLAYAQYQQLMASKCFRLGVELLVVNPAYTSVIGRVKYAVPYGRSVHLAAAGVIARRGQGLAEKPPGQGSVRIPVRGTTKCFPLPVRKEGVSNSGAWVAIGRDLTVFLRKDYLSGFWLKPSDCEMSSHKVRFTATRGKRHAGAKGRIASGAAGPRRPSDGTVPSRARINMLDSNEQICQASI